MDSRNSAITPGARQYSIQTRNQQTVLADSLQNAIERHDQDTEHREKRTLEWNRWLGSDEDESDLVLQSLQYKRKELAQTWQKFQIDFQSGSSSTSWSQIPTVNELREAVENAQVARDNQRKGMTYTAKSRFMDFLDTMNDHSFLFKFIPVGDKYVSLMTGVITSVVKVSVNHQRIDEAFSLALVELGSDLRFVRQKTKFDSPRMRGLVVDLYVQVFTFLCLAMSWYTSKRKRFRASMNKNFYDDVFHPPVEAMQQTIIKIQREAEDLTQESVRSIDSKVSWLVQNQVAGDRSRKDDDEETIKKLERLSEAILGENMLRTLVAVEVDKHIGERLVSNRQAPLVDTVMPVLQTQSELAGKISSQVVASEDGPMGTILDEDLISETERKFTRHQIKELARRFEAFAEDGRVSLTNHLRGQQIRGIPQEVISELQKWIYADASNTRWVEGAPSTFGSELSLAAIRLCDLSIQENLPCLSVFMKPHYDFSSKIEPKLAQREAATIALIYSLISQLVRLIPPEFEKPSDLNPEKFGLLDGSLASAPVALALMEPLLALAPPAMICIIGGFELAETSTTRPHLLSLMAILLAQQTKRIFKLCVISQGNSSVLAKSIGVRDRVDASRMAQGGSGVMIRGASSADELQGRRT